MTTREVSSATRFVRFTAVVAVFGLLAGGGTLYAGGSGGETASAGGASSPEGAVEELMESVRSSDPLGVLAILHPDERTLVKTLYESAGTAAESTGGVDVDLLLQSLYVDVSAGALSVEPLADGIAWVSTETLDVGLDVDVKAADAALAVDLSDVEFEPVHGTSTPAADGVGLVAVRAGDDWFVSALYTLAEIGRRGLELPPRFAPGPPVAAASAASPTDAVVALFDAVSRKDPRAVSTTLSPFEARLVADYESSLGGELVESLAPYTIGVDPVHVQLVPGQLGEQDETIAVVEVDAWSVAVAGGDEVDSVDFLLDVNGLCGNVRSLDADEGGYEEDSSCAFQESSALDVGSILADGGWRGPRFVVVNEGGSWTVSLLRTVLYIVEQFLTDPLTAASAAELVYSIFGDPGPDFYSAVMTVVAGGKEPVPAGNSEVATQGHGRSAIFRLVGPSSVTVEASAADCGVYFFDPLTDEFNGFAECGEPYLAPSGESFALVTGGVLPFTGPAPLGTVGVTVQPS